MSFLTARVNDLIHAGPVLQSSRSLEQKEGFLMANTFSQIHIQTVFAVSGRLSLITSDFKEELHKYITGIVTKQEQKLIRINGMPDHLHILIGNRQWRSRILLETSNQTPRNGLIERSWRVENSPGRRSMARSRMVIRS